MDIADKQIEDTVEGRTNVTVHLSGESLSLPVELYRQRANGEDKFWIEVRFLPPRQMSESLYRELQSLFTGEQTYNTDPEVIRLDMSHEEFLNKYALTVPRLA